MRRTAFAVVMVLSWPAGPRGRVPRGRRARAGVAARGPAAAAKARSTDADGGARARSGASRAGHPVEALAELRRGIGVSAGKLDVLVSLHWEVARVQMDRRDFVQTMTACQVLGKLPAAPRPRATPAPRTRTCSGSGPPRRSTRPPRPSRRTPDCYEAKVAEGRAEEFALDTAKSEAAYRAAIALRPDAVEPHVGLGRMLWRNGRRDDGVAELRRALALDADGPDGLFELGWRSRPGAESVGRARARDARARLVHRGVARARDAAARRGAASPTRRRPPTRPSEGIRRASRRRSSSARWRSPRGTPTTRSAPAKRR